MDSKSEVLLKLYELGAQEIHLHETTVVFQLVVLFLTAVGIVVWLIVKGSAKESDLVGRLSRAPFAAFLVVALIFLWTLYLGKNEAHIVDHGWKNHGIEQYLLQDLANKYGVESRTFLPVNASSRFDVLACRLLLPSIYEDGRGYCHGGASDILVEVVIGDLLLAMLIFWLMGATLTEARGTKRKLLLRVVISAVAFSSSFFLHVVLIR